MAGADRQASDRRHRAAAVRPYTVLCGPGLTAPPRRPASRQSSTRQLIGGATVGRCAWRQRMQGMPSPGPGCEAKCRTAFAARGATLPAIRVFVVVLQACHAALDTGGRLRRDPSDFPPKPWRARKPRQWRAWTHHRTTTRMMMRRPGALPGRAPNASILPGLRKYNCLDERTASRTSGTFHPMLAKVASRMRLCCSLSE